MGNLVISFNVVALAYKQRTNWSKCLYFAKKYRKYCSD